MNPDGAQVFCDKSGRVENGQKIAENVASALLIRPKGARARGAEGLSAVFFFENAARS